MRSAQSAWSWCKPHRCRRRPADTADHHNRHHAVTVAALTRPRERLSVGRTPRAKPSCQGVVDTAPPATP
jgi:hypothetical protein